MPNFRSFWHAGKSSTALRTAGSAWNRNARYNGSWFKHPQTANVTDEWIDLNPPATTTDFWFALGMSGDNFLGGTDGYSLRGYDEDGAEVFRIEYLAGSVAMLFLGSSTNFSTGYTAYGPEIATVKTADDSFARYDIKLSYSGTTVTASVSRGQGEAQEVGTFTSTYKHPRYLQFTNADAGGGIYFETIFSSEHDTRPYSFVKVPSSTTKGLYKGLKTFSRKIANTDDFNDDYGLGRASGEAGSVVTGSAEVTLPVDENIYGYAVGGHVRSPRGSTLRFAHLLEDGTNTYEGATQGPPTVDGDGETTVWATDPGTAAKWASQAAIEAYRIGVAMKESA